MLRRLGLGVLFAVVVVAMLPMLGLWALQIWALITLPTKLEVLEPPAAQVQAPPGGMTAFVEPAAPPEPAPEPALELQLLDKRGRRLDTHERAMILTPEAINLRRWISLTLLVDPRALADPGETLPDGIVRDVFVEARAAQVLADLCAVVDEILAARCVVKAFGAREMQVEAPEQADPGQPAEVEPVAYELTGRLLFVPADPVGPLPAGPVLVADERRVALFNVPLDDPGLDRQNAALRRALGEAKSACDGLRAELGTCTIARVRLRVFSRDGPRVRAEADLIGLRTGTEADQP